jgi:hypothetical protein
VKRPKSRRSSTGWPSRPPQTRRGPRSPRAILGSPGVVVRGLRASANGRQGRPGCDALGGCDLRGDERTRTADPLLAKQVLYQLSYVPVGICGNVEPRPCTSSRQRMTSQHLTDGAGCEPRTRAFPRGKCRRRPDDGGVVPSSPSSSRQHPRGDDLGPTPRRVRSSPAFRAPTSGEHQGGRCERGERSPRIDTGKLLPYLLERCTARARPARRVRWPRSPIPARSGR